MQLTYAASASSSSAATRSSNVIPAACAASGVRLVSVRPGTVLSSRIGGAPSPAAAGRRARSRRSRSAAGGQRGLPRLRADLGRHHELGRARRVAGVEVVAVLAERDRLDGRQRAPRSTVTATSRPSTNRSHSTWSSRRAPTAARPAAPRRRRRGAGRARAAPGRLDHQRQADPLPDPHRAARRRPGRARPRPTRRRTAGSAGRPPAGGAWSRSCRSRHAGAGPRAGVRDAGSSSSSCTVPSSPSRPCMATNARRAAAASAAAEAGVGVEHQRLVAEPAQRQLDAGAAALGDGALQRAAAGQDRDAHRP